MKADEEGFLYPQVDAGKCTGCGLCDRICPATKSAVYQPQQKRRGYLIRHTDNAILHDSTSGGFFTAIAEWTFQQDGMVCAATFDEEFRVVHAFAEHGDDLHRFRGSKYVQSDLKDCFLRIRAALKTGKIVTFVGTPCQVYGLKAFLGHVYDNLYTVDLVCHGVPSPKLWEVYFQYQQHKHHAKVVDVSFRSKEFGYQSSSMKLVFDNGRVYIQSAKVDMMLRSFYADAVSRPSCYACQFKLLERCSDFTIYDAWHAHQLLSQPGKEDEAGHTNVIVHTQRAEQMLLQLPNLCVTEVDVEKAIALDGKMVRESAKKENRKGILYQDLSADNIASRVQACIPVSDFDRVLRSARPVLYRLGLLGWVRRLKQKLKR